MNSNPSANVSSKKQEALDFFVKTYLESQGAYTVSHPHLLEALLPRQLASDLGLDEHIQISFGSQEESVEALDFSYGTPTLDALLGHAIQNRTLVYQVLDFNYLKSAGFERLVEQNFIFRNAVFSIAQTAVTQAGYLILACHYLAQSDELKEGVVFPALNLETGVGLDDLYHRLTGIGTATEARAPSPLDKAECQRVIRGLKPMIQTAVDEEIQPFVVSMKRRYERDVNNLREYYDSLKQEMEESLNRTGLRAESVRDRKEKIALIPAESQRKIDDLLNKYSIRIKINPIAGMRFSSPVVKVMLRLKVGRQKKEMSLTYNPALKALEPLKCSKCSKIGYDFYFDSDLARVCPDCS